MVNQVTFVLLTYSLLQWYLLRRDRKELNPKTRSRILELLRPVFSVIVIYYQNYVAFLNPLEYQEMVLTLPNRPARKSSPKPAGSAAASHINFKTHAPPTDLIPNKLP